MQFWRTDVGNALLWGAATLGILSGIAAIFWVIGAVTGGN